MVEWRTIDHVLQFLGQVGQLRHIALINQLTMGLPHLVLDFVTLPALTLVDFQCLVVIARATMLLGEILDWLLDERKVNPHLGFYHVHVH